MVEGQPTFVDELPKMLELLRGAVVVGHNVRFDLGFLRKEFRRSGQEMAAALGEAHVLDTVRIARRRFGRGGNGLQALSRRLGYLPDIAHRALADVRSTVAVFERMMEPIGGWNLPFCDALLAQGGKMGLLPLNPRESLLPLELEEALEMRKPVMMEYLDARDERTQRIIEPRTIRRRKGELILIAHCQLRQAQRTFKLERIVQMTRIEPTQQPSLFPAPSMPETPVEIVVSSAQPVQPPAPQLLSADVQAQIDDLLLSGASQSMGEAESQFLDSHLGEIAQLVTSLSDDEFSSHEAVKLLFSHGSRPWEDALTYSTADVREEFASRPERGTYSSQEVAFTSLPEEGAWQDIALLEEVQDARNLNGAGVEACLRSLRSRRGFERARLAGYFDDAGIVRAAAEHCEHPVSFAFLAPIARDFAQPSTLRMPIEPAYSQPLATVEFASPKHLALVEIIRRAYKRRAMEIDRHDKQARLGKT